MTAVRSRQAAFDPGGGMEDRDKAIVLIIDGAAGWPADQLGGRTTLEAARIPNLDRMAAEAWWG